MTDIHIQNAKKRPLRIFRDEDGWWMDASMISPDVPAYGPYDTKAEAKEAKRSYLHSHPEYKK